MSSGTIFTRSVLLSPAHWCELPSIGLSFTFPTRCAFPSRPPTHNSTASLDVFRNANVFPSGAHVNPSAHPPAAGHPDGAPPPHREVDQGERLRARRAAVPPRRVVLPPRPRLEPHPREL